MATLVCITLPDFLLSQDSRGEIIIRRRGTREGECGIFSKEEFNKIVDKFYDENFLTTNQKERKWQPQQTMKFQ